jgi:uncharacterized membrane protein YsdA (DUF1294 family)
MLLGWILILSTVTFGMMARDKYQSILARDRIAESTLFGLALLGGAPGLVAGMFLLRHKIQKPRFLLVAGIIAGIQVSLLLWHWFG